MAAAKSARLSFLKSKNGVNTPFFYNLFILTSLNKCGQFINIVQHWSRSPFSLDFNIQA